jgi:hypothetical protein
MHANIYKPHQIKIIHYMCIINIHNTLYVNWAQ